MNSSRSGGSVSGIAGGNGSGKFGSGSAVLGSTGFGSAGLGHARLAGSGTPASPGQEAGLEVRPTCLALSGACQNGLTSGASSSGIGPAVFASGCLGSDSDGRCWAALRRPASSMRRAEARTQATCHQGAWSDLAELMPA